MLQYFQVFLTETETKEMPYNKKCTFRISASEEEGYAKTIPDMMVWLALNIVLPFDHNGVTEMYFENGEGCIWTCHSPVLLVLLLQLLFWFQAFKNVCSKVSLRKV